jgi:hypothetical protein
MLVLARPQLGVLLPSLLFWGAGSLILVFTYEGMDLVFVLLWLAFGIPVGMLYCLIVRSIGIALRRILSHNKVRST